MRNQQRGVQWLLLDEIDISGSTETATTGGGAMHTENEERMAILSEIQHVQQNFQNDLSISHCLETE
ncbi:hypothetical protein ON010_g5001 [Phytophthora cinnamomi]|nr:hypothetical protein ON010_g5001 [Phytophthora cinnamomi]